VLIEEDGRLPMRIILSKVLRGIHGILTLPVEYRDVTAVKGRKTTLNERNIVWIKSFKKPSATFGGLPGSETCFGGLILG
jgi:hypothetical protein